MADMSMTLQEVEDARSVMNIAVAEAVQKFEKDTGLRTSYINVTREKDSKHDGPCCNMASEYDSDRGDVAAVTVNLQENY